MTWHRTAIFSGHKGSVYALCAGRGPEHFFSTGGDGHVVQWSRNNPDEGSVIARAQRAIFSLCPLADGHMLLGDEDGGLHLIDLPSRSEMHLVREHSKGIFRVRQLPNGRVVSAGGDGILGIWDITAGLLKRQRSIPLMTGKLRDLVLNANGSALAVAGGDGTVRILETTDFNELSTFHAHEQGASALAWHPAKPVLISGGKDGALRFWHASNSQMPIMSLAAHGGTIYSIAFSLDGRLCATAGRDGRIKIWDADNFAPLDRLEVMAEHKRSINALLWDQEHGTLISAGDDRRIRSWERLDHSPILQQ